jgi:hypothetical protein
MADAVERGWEVDIMLLIGNSVRSRPMENAVCFTYTLHVSKFWVIFDQVLIPSGLPAGCYCQPGLKPFT